MHSNKCVYRCPRGLMVRLVIQRLWVRISGPAGIGGGDYEWTALSPPSIPWLRCPWARHQTPNAPRTLEQWLPTAPGVFITHCCVCALGWVKCRAPISSMGHHTWQYIITLFYLFFIMCSRVYGRGECSGVIFYQPYCLPFCLYLIQVTIAWKQTHNCLLMPWLWLDYTHRSNVSTRVMDKAGVSHLR